MTTVAPKIYLFFSLIFLSLNTSAQEFNQKMTSFWSAEIMAGKLMEVYPNFPDARLVPTLGLSFGKKHNDPEKGWATFFNNPETGVNFLVSDLGNNDIFGQLAMAIPYINFCPFKDPLRRFTIQGGLGLGYHTDHHEADSNPTNEIVGSNFNWAFQLFFYRKIKITESMNWQIGGGWYHTSNGHIRLPNYGANVLALSLKTQFYSKNPATEAVNPSIDEFPTSGRVKNAWFFRTGIGFHQLGGAGDSDPGAVKGIYSGVVQYAWYLRPYIRLRAGVTYRFYQHFHDFIVDNQLPDYIDSPRWNASNIYLSTGYEILLDHVGMDIEAGFNLYKPFFDEFYLTFENRNSVDRWFKKHFIGRLGLHAYLFNTRKKPDFNIFLGAHINANLSQADFTGFSLGLIRNIK